MRIIGTQEFEETIRNGTTLVDFFADWCGPCKMLGPVLEEVDGMFPEINFVKINVDDNMDLAERFGIMSIPQIFLWVCVQDNVSMPVVLLSLRTSESTSSR